MARIRTIKPEFFTDSKITSLTPLARVFYVSLWCEADREGRLKWDAVSLKYRYLPADPVDADDLADDLEGLGLIRFYEADGALYAFIPSFKRHQVINNRESESTLPVPLPEHYVTRERRVPDASCGKEGRKGKEGKEGTAKVPKGTVYPQDFESFWTLYPAKVGKDAALRAWKKRKRSGDLPSLPELTEAIGKYIHHKPADREYCNPSTWLNQGRWQDHHGTPDVPLPSNTKTPQEWREACKRFKQDERWPAIGYGPQPGYGGCLVPHEILIEFQLVKGAA